MRIYRQPFRLSLASILGLSASDAAIRFSMQITTHTLSICIFCELHRDANGRDDWRMEMIARLLSLERFYQQRGSQ